MTQYNHVLIFRVVRVVCEKFKAAFDIYSPGTQDNDPELRISFGFYKIIVKPIENNAINKFKWLHPYFVAFDRVPVEKPG